VKQSLRRALAAVAGLGAALLALVIGAVLVVLLVDLGPAARRLLPAASAQLGREITVEGGLSVHVGRQLRVHLEDLTVANASWATDPALLRIGALSLTVDTRSLLSGPIRVQSLVLRDAAFSYEQRSDGDSNLPGGTAAGSAAPVDAPASPGDRTQRPGRGLRLERLETSDALVTLRHPALTAPLLLRLDGLQHAIDGDDLVTTATGRLNDEALRLEATVGPATALGGGAPIAMQLSAAFGGIAIDADAAAADLRRGPLASADARITGPNAAYLLDLLKLPALTDGPLDVELHLDDGGGDAVGRIVGAIGEFEVDAAAHAVPVAGGRAIALQGDLTGPDAAHIARLAGVRGFPGGAFDVHFEGARTPSGYQVDDLKVTIAGASLHFTGHVSEPPVLADSRGTLRIDGEDIGRFVPLAGLESLEPGPFSLDVTVNPDGGGAAVEAEAVVGAVTARASSKVSRLADLTGSRIAFEAAGENLARLGSQLGIRDLPAAPFRAAGTLQGKDRAFMLDDVALGVGEAEATLDGRVSLAPRLAGTRLRLTAEAPDLAALTPTGWPTLPAHPAFVAGDFSLDTEELRAEALEVRLGRARLTGSGAVGVAGTAIGRGRFDASAEAPSLAAVLPALPGFRPTANAFTLSARGAWSPARWEVETLQAKVAGTTLGASGYLADPGGAREAAIDIDVNGSSLAALGEADAVTLPDLPFALRARLAGGGGRISAREAFVTAGDSHIDFDATYRSGEVPLLALTARADRLDISPFLPPAPPPAEPAGASAGGDAAIVSPPVREGATPGTSRAGPRDRLVPATPLPAQALRSVEGSLDVSVASLVTRSRILEDIRLRGELREGALKITEAAVRGHRGEIRGTLDATPTGDGPAYALRTRIAGHSLILTAPDTPATVLDTRAPFDVTGEFTASGADLRSLFASLDGRLVVEGHAGTVPLKSGPLYRLLFRDFTSQILGVITLSEQRDAGGAPAFPLGCLAVVVTAEGGKLRGSPAFVMQTDAVTMFGDLLIDLETEALAVNVETRARKGIGLSLSDAINPLTRVGGTLAAPTVNFDAKGALLEGGAALATGGISFLAKKFRDRFFTAADPCGALLDAAAGSEGNQASGDAAPDPGRR
jgi:hypothetical protein